MYQISDFSKKSSTSVQTLRYYDNIKLLIPNKIDPNNSYRYYTSDQLNTVKIINYLKNMGFKLKEIIQILEQYDENTLKIQKEKLENEIIKHQKTIKTLEKLIVNMKTSNRKFEIELAHLLNNKERRKTKTMKENYILAKEKLELIKNLHKENKMEECLVELENLKLQIFEVVGESDPFWTLSAGDLFTGIAFELMQNKEDVTFLNIFKFVIKDKEYIDELPEYAGKLKKDSYGYICFGSIVSAPYDTRAAVISVYKQILKPYAMFETNN